MVDDVLQETDPMEVLRWSASNGDQQLTRDVEDALCRAELLAALSAVPEPFGHEVIAAAAAAGKPIAIVSNNSAPAIEAYLAAHHLKGHIAHVAGRAYAQPKLMKPNPEPIQRATKALNVGAAACVFVGDSLFDIDGSHAAGVPIVAYANKPSKADLFTKARADVVIKSMKDIVAVLGSDK